MMAIAIGRARELTAKWFYRELWNWDIDKFSLEAERTAFLKALLLCANGDGMLTPAEREWVIGRAAASGVPEEELDELAAYPANEDINRVIDSTNVTGKARRSVIYFAIRAAAADGEYNDGEKQAVRRMAQTLGVPESDVVNIERLIEREGQLKEERIRLCFPEGNPHPA